MTCCFFSSLKTLLTVTEDSVFTPAFNVLDDGLQLAGFQVTPTGRFWVTPEAMTNIENNVQKKHSALGMAAPEFFLPSTSLKGDPRARETHHRRAHETQLFRIHHLFVG